ASGSAVGSIRACSIASRCIGSTSARPFFFGSFKPNTASMCSHSINRSSFSFMGLPPFPRSIPDRHGPRQRECLVAELKLLGVAEGVEADVHMPLDALHLADARFRRAGHLRPQRTLVQELLN